MTTAWSSTFSTVGDCQSRRTSTFYFAPNS